MQFCRYLDLLQMDYFGKILCSLGFKIIPLTFLVKMSLALVAFCFEVYRSLQCFHNNAEKTRDELRERIYEAMSEKRDSQEGEPKADKEGQEVKEGTNEEEEDAAVKNEEESKAPVESRKESTENPSEGEDLAAENVKEELDKEVSSKQEDGVTKGAEEDAEQDVKSTEEQGGKEQAEPMEQDAGGRGVEYRAHGCRGGEI